MSETKALLTSAIRRSTARIAEALIIFLTSGLLIYAADATASLSGTVSDPTGAVIPGATVVLSNTDTGTDSQTLTSGDGTYSFTALAAGHYRLEVTRPGFKSHQEGPLELGVGATLKSDATLELASDTTTTEVSAQTVQIDLTTTQVGETITAEKMTSVPLNGRSFTDLLAVQPGVVPASSAQANAVVMSGCTNTPPSGDLNPGNMSVSGQRETANGFNVTAAWSKKTSTTEPP
jgi:hypothetical protein